MKRIFLVGAVIALMAIPVELASARGGRGGGRGGRGGMRGGRGAAVGRSMRNRPDFGRRNRNKNAKDRTVARIVEVRLVGRKGDGDQVGRCC